MIFAYKIFFLRKIVNKTENKLKTELIILFFYLSFRSISPTHSIIFGGAIEKHTKYDYWLTDMHWMKKSNFGNDVGNKCLCLSISLCLFLSFFLSPCAYVNAFLHKQNTILHSKKCSFTMSSHGKFAIIFAIKYKYVDQ